MTTITGTTVIDLLNNPPFRVLPASKQLTLAFEGIYIASTTVSEEPLLVQETENNYPRYHAPTQSLHEDLYSIVVNPLDNEYRIRILGKTCIAVMSDTINSHDGGSQAVIEPLRIGERIMSWVRLLKGPLKAFIKFESSEIATPSISYNELILIFDTDDLFENGSLFTSIKNPYKRIDTSSVSRHIIVKVKGEVVA